jgi:hypothetical protein
MNHPNHTPNTRKLRKLLDPFRERLDRLERDSAHRMNPAQPNPRRVDAQVKEHITELRSFCDAMQDIMNAIAEDEAGPIV